MTSSSRYLICSRHTTARKSIASTRIDHSTISSNPILNPRLTIRLSDHSKKLLHKHAGEFKHRRRLCFHIPSHLTIANRENQTIKSRDHTHVMLRWRCWPGISTASARFCGSRNKSVRRERENILIATPPTSWPPNAGERRKRDNRKLVESIAQIRRATLRQLWTDLPEDYPAPGQVISACQRTPVFKKIAELILT